MIGPAIEIVHGRHNPGIDPSLHLWGWEVAVYLFLGGLAAGLFVLPALLEIGRGERNRSRALRLAPLISLAILTAGLAALFLDLEQKTRFYRFFLAFKPASPMSWGSWILLLAYPIGLLLGLGGLTDDERRRVLRSAASRPLRGILEGATRFSDRRRSAILKAAIVTGGALGVYTGLLLGALGARPLWNTALLGPLFLLSGLSTGAAFLLLFRPGGEETERLVRWDMALIVGEMLFIFLVVLDLASGGETARAAADQLLGGVWTGPFWSIVVVAGLATPAALEFAEIRNRWKSTALAPLLVLAGGFALRWILLAAGQAGANGVIR